MAGSNRKLLPAVLKPILYEIRLEPRLQADSFCGNTSISCEVIAQTSIIKLHCNFIKISAAAVEYRGTTLAVDIESIRYDAADETVEFRVSQDLCPSETVKITLTYAGKFKADLEGLYRSTYTNAETEYCIATTNLEPTYARQVFPCFDEPHMKAEFRMSAIVDESFLCVSNMPSKDTFLLPESKKLVVFETTPRMSTYLVALMTGPLTQVHSATRVPLSVVCPLGCEEEAAFALDLAAKGLQLFEDLFEIPYPLPKLDLGAVPDFSAGAMENWGLILFRKNSLLLDPEDSSLEKKQEVAENILHELAHMWFGNLVTMKYWDGLWLKEGFATLMSWLATDKLFPGWHVWDKYTAGSLQAALELDSLDRTHPVEMEIRDATEAKQVFDDISYKKGCSVLMMISSELGPDRFLAGTKLYLQRHAYENTTSEDLWSAIQEATGDSIRQKMQIWTKQPGYPVITITEVTEDEAERVVALHIRQDRFLSTPGGQPQGADDAYALRLGIRSDNGIQVVDANTKELTVRTSESSFLKVNADHTAFCRVSYTASHLRKLLQAAADNKLTLRDCIGLSCDLKALVGAGVNKTSELMELLVGLMPRKEFLVWEMIDRNLRSVRSTFKFHEASVTNALKKVVVDIIGPKCRDLGWEISDADSDDMVSFKASMFSTAGLAGDKEVITAALEMFARRASGDAKAIHPSLKWEVFGIAAEHGGREELEQLLDLWRTSPSEDEQYLALECLGRASTAELVTWVLELAFTKDVRDQDLHVLVWLIGSSAHGAAVLWGWMKENWARMETTIPADLRCMILGVVLDALSTEEQIVDVKAYFKSRDSSAYQQVLEQKVEGMEIRRCWAERDAEDVKAWLSSHGYLDSQILGQDGVTKSSEETAREQ